VTAKLGLRPLTEKKNFFTAQKEKNKNAKATGQKLSWALTFTSQKNAEKLSRTAKIQVKIFQSASTTVSKN